MISSSPMEKMINYTNRPRSLNFSDNTRTGPKFSSSLPGTLALRLRLYINDLKPISEIWPGPYIFRRQVRAPGQESDPLLQPGLFLVMVSRTVALAPDKSKFKC